MVLLPFTFTALVTCARALGQFLQHGSVVCKQELGSCTSGLEGKGGQAMLTATICHVNMGAWPQAKDMLMLSRQHCPDDQVVSSLEEQVQDV